MRRPPRASTRGRPPRQRRPRGDRPPARRRQDGAEPRDAVLADVPSGEEWEQQDQRRRARRTSPLMPVDALEHREQHRQGGKPEQDALVTARHGRRLRVGAARVVGTFRRRRGRWTNVRCGEKPRGGDRGAAAAVRRRRCGQAARRKRPDRRSTSNQTLQPRSLQSTPQRLASLASRRRPKPSVCTRLGIEAVALVGDLDAGEVLAQAGEEHDALVAAQAGVADGVADDLRGEQRDGVLDVLVEAVRRQRTTREPGGFRARLESEKHVSGLGGGGHEQVLPRPSAAHALRAQHFLPSDTRGRAARRSRGKRPREALLGGWTGFPSA